VKVALLLAIAASGCNSIYDITSTRSLDAAVPIDAQYFDAPADAPPACPAAGVEPKFKAAYNQLAEAGGCTSFTPAFLWGKAVGVCNSRIKQGALAGPMDTELGIVPLGFTQFPRVSQDGALLFVENNNTLKIDIWARNSDDTWSKKVNTIDDASYRFISNATVGSPRHAIQTDYNGASYQLRELVEQTSGDWASVDLYLVSELGVGTVDQQSLSSDGLHMTFTGVPLGSGTKTSVWWTRRADTSSHFGPAVELTTVPVTGTTPFMADDCSRYYFSGLGAVFYQTQL
jgi:hypothetical protein